MYLCKLDVTIVVDSSGSIEEYFQIYKTTLLHIIHLLPVIGPDAALVSVVQYSEHAHVVVPFHINQTKEWVIGKIVPLEFLGSTTLTAEAVRLGIKQMQNFHRPDSHKLFILMSDGNSFNEWQFVLSTADLLHSLGTDVLVIALGSPLFFPELEAYAGRRGVLLTNESLNRLFPFITDEVGPDCGHQNMFVTGSTTVAYIEERTTTMPVDKCPAIETDLVLVFDSSGSVEKVFSGYKSMAINIIRTLPIGPKATLVAVVQYSGSSAVKLRFGLDETYDQVFDVVKNLEWLGSTTKTADAVLMGIDQFKLAPHRNARRLFVLLTDGNSFDPWEKVQETAQKLHETGSKFVLVAFGETLGERELQEYAGHDGIIVYRNETKQLFNIIRQYVRSC
ncbi:unnamed protein product [Soboliphyme baturini]|uniref:VWFA domain-containing protein n=1 Tax=Soboliphyme baturini TaxID=241478 RepID=A0A183IUQ9_9BILA|nr:unnamed protein product [Soboliphyme baturini]